MKNRIRHTENYLRSGKLMITVNSLPHYHHVKSCYMIDINTLDVYDTQSRSNADGGHYNPVCIKITPVENPTDLSLRICLLKTNNKPSSYAYELFLERALDFITSDTFKLKYLNRY